MDKDCPFCTTAREEKRILKEGKYAYVVLSNPRFVPGHLLVIPKRHIDGRLQELTKEERAEIFDLLTEFQGKILDKLSSGCDIRQQFKPYVKNSRTHVDHMHWHLDPRDFKDRLYEKAYSYREQLYEDLTEEEIIRITKLLK